MLQKGSFKLIHARFGTSGINMMPLKQKWRVPLITSFHGVDSPSTDMMKKRRKRMKQLFAIGDCFTTPCEAMRNELIKHGCPAKKIVVHYSGIDVSKFSYKERAYPDSGPVRIIYVGRLVEKKGADLLIRAFAKVHRMFPNTRLTLIGEGELRRKLMVLSKKLRLGKHIDFMGALKHREVARQLEQAHIFCLPSMQDRTGNKEGIPNAIKEAMACGLPVVSTYHSGIPELIQDGVSGHLVAEKDVNGIAKKLITLIRHPKSWKNLGRSAREKIEADFNLQIQREKLEQLFDRVIKDHERQENVQPFFSVIIPTYNREKYIGKAISSVMRQTCTDYELIVVDDGSKDHTAKIVRSYGARVRYVYQKNQGPSAARNTGIRMARGKYIAFLDSDDLFLPNKLSRNKKYLLNNPNARFLYSWYYADKKGRKKKELTKLKGFTDIKKFRNQLYKRKFTIRTSTVIIHPSCLDKIGFFNRKYRYSQDWDMWLRLAGHYHGYCQRQPLSIYRRHTRKRIPGSKRHYKIRQRAKLLFKHLGSTK